MKLNRRNLIRNGLLTTAALMALPLKASAAEKCLPGKTPPQVEGPFYPVVDQLDTDSDLIQIQGSNVGAKGKIVIIEGIVTDQLCVPVAGTLVEIWQACDLANITTLQIQTQLNLIPIFSTGEKL